MTGALLAAACASNVDEGPDKVGQLYVEVEIAPALKLPDGSNAGREAAHSLSDSDISITLTSEGGRYTHTWPVLSQFTQGDDYFAGPYILAGDAGRNSEQGFDTPRFTGSTTLTIGDNSRESVRLVLTPESAFFAVSYSEAFLSAYPGGEISVQSATSECFAITAGETRLLSLDTAPTAIYLSLPGTAAVRAIGLETPQSATLYEIAVDASTEADGTPVVEVGISGGERRSIRLTPEFLAAEPPHAEWEEGVPSQVELPEGENYDAPLVCRVKPAGETLERVTLTINSASLAAKGVPMTADVLKTDSEATSLLRKLGLKVSLTATAGGTIDFNDLLGQLVFTEPAAAQSTFSVVAEGSDGRISQAAMLRVVTTPVDLTVTSVTGAVMGVNRTEITVVSPATDFMERVELQSAGADSVWHELPVASAERISPDTYRLTADLGDGSADVAVRVVYCDEVRSTFTVRRIQPDFSIVVDAFAAYADILVVPAEPSLLTAILDRLHLYVDDRPYNLFTADPERGVVTIIGLKPSTSYSVNATMMDAAEAEPQFCNTVRFTTEGTPQLPNADFEERRDGPAYKNLPSGGRYSQTTVEIFNRQHMVTFDMRVPKNWTTVNEKTFNSAFANHNTWYMYPSTYSLTTPTQNGTFAVELQTTGFDPDGEEIAPYAQTGTPYLDYSPATPRVGYKAAGRLFLGNYSFDPATMTETYDEGVSWGARPTSLNGYYIFTPCDDDRSDAGLVRVEVLGTIDGEVETVIASAEMRLPLCTGWKAFSLPLAYDQFGVKARRLKVMFASSVHAGTIEQESATIVTTTDPESATSLGGRLALDNIYLSY